jgi:hypothetical protein
MARELGNNERSAGIDVRKDAPPAWSYAGGQGFFKPVCICTWIATHKRTRRFYRLTVKEQAQFTCDCPARMYYETRDRIKEYEVDSPGARIVPSQETMTAGPTFQLGANSGAHPMFKSTVVCACPAPTP